MIGTPAAIASIAASALVSASRLGKTATLQRWSIPIFCSSVIAAILTADPRPVSELIPATPASLDRVVKSCLAKNPDERPSSYGFTRYKTLPSLSLGMLFAIIYDLALSYHAGTLLWIPLRRQPATRVSLATSLPISAVGLAVTVAVWGLVEAFFGVFFARKLNDALRHDGYGWMAPNGYRNWQGQDLYDSAGIEIWKRDGTALEVQLVHHRAHQGT